jgi:ASPIC and UnbV/FG-GAP-like repeat/FlgD Ig-like domain
MFKPNHRPFHWPIFRVLTSLLILSIILLSGLNALAATEQEKNAAIKDGLVWLASTQAADGSWYYANDGTLAATAAAALAFIETKVEPRYLPGQDVVINGTNYGDVVGRAVEYILGRASIDSRFAIEYTGYTRYAEDYNNDGFFGNDGGNDQAIYFVPTGGTVSRRLYTTGLCAPVVFALGEALHPDTVIGMGAPLVSGMTYAELMQDIVDWFSFGQVEPNRGTQRGGWRYDANYPNSDNSTAQWGSLPLLYAKKWGLGTPDYVFAELELWVNYIQHSSGGSGYSTPEQYLNVAKTGGLLLELSAIDAPFADSRVQAALGFIDSRWNTTPSGTWYGNLNHPYAMWAVYKGLETYHLIDTESVVSAGEEIYTGLGMPAAVSGITIGNVQDPMVSGFGDWYSHYCDYLVSLQNADGSWTGYGYHVGPLAVGWYINILNAGGLVPPSGNPDISISSMLVDPDEVCGWNGDGVHHEATYRYGTPGFPNPDIAPAEDLTVEIRLSDQMVFGSASGSGQYDPVNHSVVWIIGEVPDGTSGTVMLETFIGNNATPGNTLNTRAYVSASNVDPDEWGSDLAWVLTCEEPPPPECYPDLPDPQLAFEGVENYENGGVDITRYLFDVVNWAEFRNDLFVLSPDLPPCGNNPNASRSWVYIYDGNGNQLYGFCAFEAASSLQDIWFNVPTNEVQPAEAYIVIWDRLCDIRYTSNVVDLGRDCVWADATIPPLDNTTDGHGIAWGDFDNDGDDDLFLANAGENALLRNDGNGNFVKLPHLNNNGGDSRSAAWGDYDNDGDLDLYVVNWGTSNCMYRNDGNEVFVNVTTGALACDLFGNSAAWCDIDNDGDLDLFFTNFEGPNKLLRNDDGVFVSLEGTPCAFTDKSRGCAFGDYNNDNIPDLYVSVDDGANHLFQGDGGGVFTDVTVAPLDDMGKGKGVAWGDYDNDGDLDLYLVNQFTANRLFNNDGGVFTNVADAVTGDTGDGRSCGWGDYNNDGWMDLFITNFSGENRLFHNLSGVAFADSTCGPLETPITAWGMGWSDYDNDGDLDMYVSHHQWEGLPNYMFRNDLVTDKAWLQVELVGSVSNRYGVGAKVVVENVATRTTQMRHVSAGSSYLSQPSVVTQFGVGWADRVDMTVYWPSGVVQRLENQPVNQRLVVSEAAAMSGTENVTKPLAYEVSCYPNPFNPMTNIEFSLPRAGEVSMRVYDITGRLVRTILSGTHYDAGTHAVVWNGTDGSGMKVASGVYFYRYTAADHEQTGRMMLLK